jgi:protein-L-isoaspartate(D-aspartate) O-methyltransferase
MPSKRRTRDEAQDRTSGGGSRDLKEALIRAIETEGVRDRRVLDAFRRVPRERFVPGGWWGRAYEDRPIPIGHGQVTTQPSLIARMVAGLGLKGEERVLEVGTGLGYQSAVLAMLAREVFSIERFPDLAEWARRNLEAAEVPGVTVVVGDGTKGFPERAPFDATMVSAAAPRGRRSGPPAGPRGIRDRDRVPETRGPAGRGGSTHPRVLRPAGGGVRHSRGALQEMMWARPSRGDQTRSSFGRHLTMRPSGTQSQAATRYS